MKTIRFFLLLVSMVFVGNLFAQAVQPVDSAKESETCEVLIKTSTSILLREMRKEAPKIELKSCDEWLKGEVIFEQNEYPNAPTLLWRGSTVKWSDAAFGRTLAVHTVKSSGRQFNYNGTVEVNTNEEFLFSGRDGSSKVDAKFHVKRNKDAKVTYVLYEFDSRVSGIYRIGKE